MFLFLLACHRNIGFENEREASTDAWQDLAFEITMQDGIDYQKLQENRDILEDYLSWVGDNGPRMNRFKGVRWKQKGREDRRITHYANAYNAWVLYEILENYPIDSVESLTLDRFQLFDNAYKIDGEYMTLHHVKEERILGTYQEPLLHLMLYDGSISSPQFQYWKHDQLKNVLKNWIRRYLASEAGAKKEGEDWFLSALFQKEEDDFMYWSNVDNLCQYLSDYAEDELLAWLEEQGKQNCSLKFQSWNYSLNK